VPTIGEDGVAVYKVFSWFGLVAPAGYLPVSIMRA
jgi:tripartite-type tricarboxylate transporter receptor subunit TctC